MFMKNSIKTNYILAISLIVISIFSGILVSPLNKGLSILYKKPVAKEIQKIIKKEKNAVFITSDTNIYLSNYLVANGAKTLNSVNFLPNLDLYHKLDPALKYEKIYNRYHHININIIQDKTNFKLKFPDSIELNLNKDSICIANINYIVTTSKNKRIYKNFTKVYDKYNMKIYKTGCK